MTGHELTCTEPMGMDLRRLSDLCRYDDPEAGVREEFLRSRLGPGGSFAVLSRPLGESHAAAWIVCPSIGPEHGNLRRLEARIARTLAAAGHATLRIRPDLHPLTGAWADIDLTARLEEVRDAARVLRDDLGFEEVCSLGALFGGTVAALTSSAIGAQALCLVEPATSGRRYLRETIRRQAIAEVIAAGAEDAQVDGAQIESEASGSGPLAELSSRGETWIRGLRLTRDEHDRISAIDLARDVTEFRGSALLVGASPSGEPSRSLAALRDQLAAAGGDVRLEVVTDPLSSPLGEYHYREAGLLRIDTRLELEARIDTIVRDWVVETSGAFAGAELG